MLLCDAAQEVGGKLYVLGGGWTHLLRPNQPVTMALGIVVAVEWNETNTPHTLEVCLVNEDGAAVAVDGKPIQAGARIEVGRPPRIKPGSDINAPLAMTFQGILLAPGGYVWQLKRGGEVLARTPFWVLEAD
jgi:hypothetical protein